MDKGHVDFARPAPPLEFRSQTLRVRIDVETDDWTVHDKAGCLEGVARSTGWRQAVVDCTGSMEEVLTEPFTYLRMFRRSPPVVLLI
jgi:hypothetical protein